MPSLTHFATNKQPNMPDFAIPILWKLTRERGLKGVVEVCKSDLPVQGARVKDLYPVINEKVQAILPAGEGLCEVESFLLYGTRVSLDRLVESLAPELGNSPRFVAIMRIHTKSLAKTIAIFVQTLNKLFRITCYSENSIGYVKTAIRQKENIPEDRQTLVYKGMVLENHLRLSSYGIKNRSQVYLQRNLRGGGVPARIFADITDESSLVLHEFSRDAPKWRIAYQGLNIEGECKNDNCAAFGDMVVHPKHFGIFNLMKDDDICCPLCREKVEARTCGFYDCAWKFDGSQANNGYSIISQWKDACGYKYHRFDAEKTHGYVEWESLLIVARRRGKPTTAASSLGWSGIDECTICSFELASTGNSFVITTDCGHSFHGACVDKWKEWCTTHETLPSCPLCRRELSTVG